MIAYFAPQDQYHKRALKLRDYLGEKEISFLTSWPVVAEASTILLYHYGYSHSLALFKALKVFQIFLPEESDYEKAQDLFVEFNQEYQLSFNDILSYQIIQEHLKNVPILTFDKGFSKIGLTVFVP